MVNLIEDWDRSTPISAATAAILSANVGVETSTVGFILRIAWMWPLVSSPPPEMTRAPSRRTPQ